MGLCAAQTPTAHLQTSALVTKSHFLGGEISLGSPCIAVLVLLARTFLNNVNMSSPLNLLAHVSTVTPESHFFFPILKIEWALSSLPVLSSVGNTLLMEGSISVSEYFSSIYPSLPKHLPPQKHPFPPVWLPASLFPCLCLLCPSVSLWQMTKLSEGRQSLIHLLLIFLPEELPQ